MRRSDRDCCSGLTAEISCCHLRLTLVWPPLLRWSDSHDAVGLTTGISPVGPSNPSKHKLKISQNRWQLYYFFLCLQSATKALLMKISAKLETLTILTTQCSLKRYREASPSLSIYTWGKQPKTTNQTQTRSPNPPRKPFRTRNQLYKLQLYQIWTPSKFWLRIPYAHNVSIVCHMESLPTTCIDL